MKYLLDSSACIAYIRRCDSLVKQRINNTAPADMVLCTPVLTELVRGIYRSRTPQQERLRVQAFVQRFVVLPFDSAAAEHAGRVRAELDALGRPIGVVDVYIAAVAIAGGLTLVKTLAMAASLAYPSGP
ncbi:MAG: type II toxin-antitoxin system VapC family toxin [Chloroflexaceae bacterium]|nr:type II toxin-antitoxin system VapC family toxin [Chloroflexaceae bacterium]NJO08044.1 type II toxin-antitoxin system VapC family toxin [Chloroflexaceae bacterium]